MRKIELKIVALTQSVTQSQNYAVVLQEVDGIRRLPIVIGGFEAQAVAVAMENMAPTRPLTHDLFRNTLDTFNVKLEEVVINNLLDGIFYAQLICKKGNNTIEIDSRTSDAIALAVRFQCSIYTYEFIMDAAGVEFEEESYADSPQGQSGDAPAQVSNQSLSSLPTDELNRMLEEVLHEEDYERAAEIRDEINKRKQERGG